MKQKSGGIKRLMEFTGKHRGLLVIGIGIVGLIFSIIGFMERK